MEKILFVPDTHAPYHDVVAFELMLKAAQWWKPDRVVVLGDFADFYSVSSHDKNPTRSRDLEWELTEVRRLLDQLLDLDASRYTYIAGNHEDRLERYLSTRAPELFRCVKIPALLQIQPRWEYIPYRDHIKIGKLYVTHDLGKSGPGALRSALQRYQSNCVIGHTHRMEMQYLGSVNGDTHVGASFGWLGDIDAVDYMHRAEVLGQWQTGFGLGYLNEDTGAVYLQAIPMVEAADGLLGCCIEGKLFSASL